MSNIYINKNEENAISVAIYMLQSYIDNGGDDSEVDSALNELIALESKIERAK